MNEVMPLARIIHERFFYNCRISAYASFVLTRSFWYSYCQETRSDNLKLETWKLKRFTRNALSGDVAAHRHE
jgi:hypothetical protein